MKKTLIVLSLLLLGFSKSFAQEGTSSINLIRTGIGFFQNGPHGDFDIVSGLDTKAFGLLMPSYVRLDRHLYFSASLPTIGWQKGGDYTQFTFSINPSAGYVFGKSESRFRPFVAGVLNFRLGRYDYRYNGYLNSQGLPAGNINGHVWKTNTWLELRLGSYYRITDRIWMDLLIEAPTGHALYKVRTRSGQDLIQEVFGDVYDTYLPKVQLGVSYQIR